MTDVKTSDQKTRQPSRKNTLCKDERLSRKKIIDDVFKRGASIKSQALILVYLHTELPVTFPAQAMFTASKKLYKRAHDRNRIKRLLKEAYRKQKHIVYNSLKQSEKQAAILFIFTGRQLPNYPYVHGKMSELLKKFVQQEQAVKKTDTSN